MEVAIDRLADGLADSNAEVAQDAMGRLAAGFVASDTGEGQDAMDRLADGLAESSEGVVSAAIDRLADGLAADPESVMEVAIDRLADGFEDLNSNAGVTDVAIDRCADGFASSTAPGVSGAPTDRGAGEDTATACPGREVGSSSIRSTSAVNRSPRSAAAGDGARTRGTTGLGLAGPSAAAGTAAIDPAGEVCSGRLSGPPWLDTAGGVSSLTSTSPRDAELTAGGAASTSHLAGSNVLTSELSGRSA